MNDTGPEKTFHGLPLTDEQESEIRHYMLQRKRQGLPLDMHELREMVKDMINPPLADSNGVNADAEFAQADAEHAASLTDNSGDPISASEERTAARESEAMKHR